MFRAIRRIVGSETRRHRELPTSPGIGEEDVDNLRRLIREEDDAPPYHGFLRDLSVHLAAHHGEPVVIFVDEYDVPVQTAHAEGFCDDAVVFFRNLLSGGLKDNPNWFKGVRTGVLRIAKESIFSGRNNFDVRSAVHAAYATDFGPARSDVDRLAQDMGAPEITDQQRSWSDRYRFAGHTIDNPWSVMMYVANCEKRLPPAWGRHWVRGAARTGTSCRASLESTADIGSWSRACGLHSATCSPSKTACRIGSRADRLWRVATGLAIASCNGSPTSAVRVCTFMLAVHEFQRRERPSTRTLKRQPMPVTLPWCPRTRTLRRFWRRHGARRPVTNTTHSSLASEPGYPVDGP